MRKNIGLSNSKLRKLKISNFIKKCKGKKDEMKPLN
jgi:hypothetical protein